MLLVALFFVLVIIVRLAQIQILDHETYKTKSTDNRIDTQPLPPPRGLIFDRNGILIADNKQILTLSLVPEQIQDMDVLLKELSKRIAITEALLTEFNKRRKQQRRPYEPVTLKRVLNNKEAALLAVDRHLLPGAVLTHEVVRFYPNGELTAHALGAVRRIAIEDLQLVDAVKYSGSEFIGKLGVEKFYEASLHGEVGYRTVEVDANGRIMKELTKVEPVIGASLKLHLDIALQRAATTALGEFRGAIVAVEPSSGGILALVSKPTYDPNTFIQGFAQDSFRNLVNSSDQPFFNRATQGTYAPGSTFKPIVALAALEYGVIDWETEISDKGEFTLPNSTRIYRDWNWTKSNPGGQGIVNIDRAIYRSSNVFFYSVAHELGIDPLAEFATRIGFGRNTALDFPDAVDGVFPSKQWKREHKNEVWFPGDTVNLGIGQGYIEVTPLQLANAVTVIANRGVLRPLRMLKNSDRLLPEIDLEATRSTTVVSEQFVQENWEKLVDALENVVHRGNQGYGQNGIAWAHIGINIPYQMAGKSGTAQVIGIEQGEEYDEASIDAQHRKHAIFIAFAPADAPVIAVAVVVENGGGGSSVAGPIARAVIDSYLLKQQVASSG